jgi:hypothetical protein
MRLLPAQKIISICICVFCVLSLAGCGTGLSTTPTTLNGVYPVAPVFNDFYASLGGKDILGPAVSRLFEHNGKQYQYTANALMVYDELAPDHLSLDKIAPEWQVFDPSEPIPQDPSIPYLNGHQVWSEVRPYYERLGTHYLGLPLTGVRYNEEHKRYEQFFENMGFYRNASDPEGMVKVMPYGDWFCAKYCAYQIHDMAPTPYPPPPENEYDSLFEDLAPRIYNLTGVPISKAYQAQDSFVDKLYENVLVYVDPLAPTRNGLRPLPEMVGIYPDPPVPASGAPGMYFYVVQGDLGYNVPKFFWDYLLYHGGFELSGPPITELHAKADGISRQCFVNYCLEYHANGPEESRVRPSTLGNRYLAQNPKLAQVQVSQSITNINLRVWERYPLLSQGQLQEIGAEVDGDGIPLSDIEFSLVVYLPDGSQRSYYMSPTSENGITTVQIDTIDSPNGSDISYQVCTIGLLNQVVCIKGSFLIWSTP